MALVSPDFPALLLTDGATEQNSTSPRKTAQAQALVNGGMNLESEMCSGLEKTPGSW